MGVTAVVVAGAGARGAYEAGVLSVLVPRLVEQRPDDRIVVIGTSAGAINTAILAAFQDPDKASVAVLDLWSSVRVRDIFAWLPRSALEDLVSFVGHAAFGRRHPPSLLDSSPLRQTMVERLDWDQVRRNLRRKDNWLHTAGIVTTAAGSRRSVVFLQGPGSKTPPDDQSRAIDYRRAALDVPHVLASAAIPAAFRPVFIDEPAAARGWYLDGGVRLNVPLKPALDLGAERVIVVDTVPDPDQPVTDPPATAQPDVFDAAGTVLGCLLNDRVTEDVRSLRRTNKLIAATGGKHGAQSVDIDGRTRRVVPHLVLGPPRSGMIAKLANEWSERLFGGWAQLSDVGVLGRFIGGSEGTHGELLSFLMFDADFHSALIELGQVHARKTLGPARSAIPWRT